MRLVLALLFGIAGAGGAVLTVETSEPTRTVVKVCPTRITDHKGIWLV